jgi:hypothetical protein
MPAIAGTIKLLQGPPVLRAMLALWLMTALGQKAKYSPRVEVFRFTPESRHSATHSACPFRANNGSNVSLNHSSVRARKDGGTVYQVVLVIQG